MKRIYFIIILCIICGLTAMAQDRPDMVTQSTGGNHDGISPFSYYRPTIEYDEMTCELRVTGNGSVEYYLVQISNAETNVVIFVTQINGTYDVIDATPLLGESCDISLSDEKGHVYHYTFDGTIHNSGWGSNPNSNTNNTNSLINVINRDNYQLK